MKIYFMNYIWEYWKALSLKGAGGIGWGIGLGVLEHSGFVSELKNSSFLSSLSPGSDKEVVDIMKEDNKCEIMKYLWHVCYIFALIVRIGYLINLLSPKTN